jgi:site-specific recombinase XerC
MRKVILPSLTREQVTYLIDQAENIRDRAIISLLADSGIRLNELLNIKLDHIDFNTQTIIIWGKGAKQRKAPFTSRTLKFLQEYLSNHTNNGYPNILCMCRRGIQIMLYRLEKKTGLPCESGIIKGDQ